MAACRSDAVLTASLRACRPHRPSVTRARRLLLGANTPWKRVRSTPGFGTRAASGHGESTESGRGYRDTLIQMICISSSRRSRHCLVHRDSCLALLFMCHGEPGDRQIPHKPSELRPPPIGPESSAGRPPKGGEGSEFGVTMEMLSLVIRLSLESAFILQSPQRH